jgi:hypothetical protein
MNVWSKKSATGVHLMAIHHVEDEELIERMQEAETILLGAFAPSLTQVTMEIECKACGRPVYVSLSEKGAAAVLCIVCGLKYFNESDRETLTKALIPQA